MDSTKRIRDTAADMRAKAQTATPEASEGWFTANGDPVDTYLASMHPAVAIAVADMLDQVANTAEVLGDDAAFRPAGEHAALALCDAYWGES